MRCIRKIIHLSFDHQGRNSGRPCRQVLLEYTSCHGFQCLRWPFIGLRCGVGHLRVIRAVGITAIIGAQLCPVS
ncbi:hypothetical protein BD309DRAFT_563914 [Dichomitus squalens]|nr:hypothetical protein BD309DRAFT_563914 [Dichomitus squalens]